MCIQKISSNHSVLLRIYSYILRTLLEMVSAIEVSAIKHVRYREVPLYIVNDINLTHVVSQ